jgi:CO/xanthine dehydrogenase FAD-binding subunit
LRASASFVGNVAQGWSVSDLVPLLQVYDAQLEILSKSGRRQLSVTDYAKKAGNGALQPGELIKGLNLPSSLPDVRVSYDRFTFREAFDLPLVSVAIKAGIRGDTYHNIRIAVVGAAVMPLRCPPAEAVLEGQPCNKDVVEKASAMLLNWAKPQGNRLCSADYQRHVLGVSFRKAMAKLAVVA